ncbi:restriction endonuclease subunit S [Cutibacterium avidum]|uniref:restriction endonuclease subunit S n=1 Tax=Cutibacterium avidum TaxID=33010 RepID=UPI00211C2EA9|nr:restriction endonuclease subunit S [Cutibacterium avidum]
MPVGTAVELQNGFPFNSEDFTDSGAIPLLRIRDLAATQFETYLDVDVPEQYIVRLGDLVVGMDGDFNCLIWKRSKAALNQRVCRLRARAGHDIRYVAYALPSELKHINDTQFATTVKHLSSSEILSSRIPSRPLEEQRRIADFLDDRVARIDQIIAARQRQLSLLASLRRLSLVDAVFRSEDTLTRCSAMVEVRLGRQRSPQNAEGDHMTPYLRSANVGDGRLFLDDVYSMNFEPSEQHIFSLERGDVLVTEGSASLGAVGAACRWNEDLPGTICFQNTLLRLRARSGVEQDFVEVWARASHANGAPRAFANGANILHLGADGMGRMPIPNISSEEQRNRVSCAREVLDACENQATRVNSEVGLLQEYKQSLITAAVTGEFDVTTASTKIPE